LPTSDAGTVDCTSSGFGTPKGALIFGGYGAANGTAVDHAGLWIGGYDGTRQRSVAVASEDGQDDSDTGGASDANSALITLLNTSQAQDGDCTASFIADGIRLTCADAPPVAYRVNVLLIGGSGVSNVYVGSATGHASTGGTTAVSDPGFTPHVVFSWFNTTDSLLRNGIGIATNEAGPTIVQRVMGHNDTNASASMSIISRLLTNRFVASGLNVAALELTSFDANGFTVTTRDSTTSVPTFGYMAIRLNGLSAKLMTSPAPAGTGSQAVTGVGFRPQVGVMFHGEWAAVDTAYSTNDGEVFGLSAFTTAGSGSSSIFTDDGVSISNTESVTANTVCRTRKNAADYATCSLTSLDADGATFNYTVNNGGAVQRAILFIQASATSRRRATPMVLE